MAGHGTGSEGRGQGTRLGTGLGVRGGARELFKV